MRRLRAVVVLASVVVVVAYLGVLESQPTRTTQAAPPACARSAVPRLTDALDRLAGLSRTTRQISCAVSAAGGGAPPTRHDVYGDCQPSANDGGCQPPLQLAATRNPTLSLDALLRSARQGLAPPLQTRRVRGWRVGSRRGGREQIVELPTLSVHIFASSRAVADTARAAVMDQVAR